MQQALALLFLAFVLLGGSTSFVNPSESPTLETVVVDETSILSEGLYTEVPITDESESVVFPYPDEDDDTDEIPSTHVPHLISTSMDFTATVGESVTFHCDVDDLRDFVLVWNSVRDKRKELLFAGNLSITRNNRFKLNGSSLTLRDLQKKDSGIYGCELGTTRPQELNHTLDVHYPPDVEAYPKDAVITAKEGESVTLTCHAMGNPRPILTWKHAGKHYDSTGEDSYTISNAQKEDSGEYECIADNQVGDPASAVITVEIVAAPKVITEPDSGLLVVKEGEPISIGCRATGDPMPHITWKKPQPAEKMMMKIHEGNKIQIAKATLADSGTYECIANNSLGISTTANIRVQVLFAPKVQMSHRRIHAREGARVNITCVAEGQPLPTITWKKEGNPLNLPPEYLQVRGHSHTLLFHQLHEEDFGMYECIASNSLSSAAGTTLLVGTPQVPLITSKPHGTQGTKYTISWTVNSHTPIDEYLLTYKKMGAEEWQEQSVAAAPIHDEEHTQMFQLSELQPSTEYEAVVKARNKFGWSDTSEVLIFTTKSEENHSETLSSGCCILNNSLSMLFLVLAICIRYYH